MKTFVALSSLLATLAFLPAAASAVPTLAPPPGWTAKDVTTTTAAIHIVGAWTSPTSRNGFPDTLNLTTENSSASYADYIAGSRAALLKAMTKTLTLDADETCGASTAHRFQFETPFGTNMLVITQLVRMTPATAYIGTYVHMAQNPEDPAALAALLTLCKGDAGTPAPNG